MRNFFPFGNVVPWSAWSSFSDVATTFLVCGDMQTILNLCVWSPAFYASLKLQLDGSSLVLRFVSGEEFVQFCMPFA